MAAADGGSADAGTSAAQACADLATASCTLRESCSDDYNINKNFADLAACEARAAANCEAELALSGTGQTPANVESCVAEYPHYACPDYFDGNPPDACAAPTGALPEGAACGADAQCETSFCALGHAAVCGTCQAHPVVGTICEVQADCGKDLACAMAASATSGTCQQYVASGGTCLTATNPCEAGFSCVGEKAATNTTGICMAAINKVGSACDGNHKKIADCDSDLGLTCIPTSASGTTGTCQAIQLVGAGEECGKIGSPVTSVIDCGAGGQCVKAASGDATGTCVAPAADGDACDSSNTVGPPCLSPAKCVPTSDGGTAGICTLPDPASCE